MLAEHVNYGLPSPEEISAELPDETSFAIYFTGDFRFNTLLFKIDHLGSTTAFRLVKAVVAALLNLVGNIVVYPLTQSTQPSPFANRMVVVISKRVSTGR
jgi:hypothetical protein